MKGSREELMGVTIPLKYLPCYKKYQGGTMNGIGVKWLYICDSLNRCVAYRAASDVLQALER